MNIPPNVVYIKRNCICYNDEILKISNISRMSIKTLFNRKRHEYEMAVNQYWRYRQWYESNEKSKKINRVTISVVLAIIFILLSLVSFNSSAFPFTYSVGLIFILGTIICLILAVISGIKSVNYPVAPPLEEPFPDTHGLFIEMNSGYLVVFTAIDEIGKVSLRRLQDQINEADVLKEPMVFNMMENHIEVEQNDGIINMGDYAKNTVAR